MYSKKYIIVGEVGVGKTSISHRYVNNKFEKKTPATIGVEFFTKNLSPNNKINIWDTSGACRFNSIIPAFFRSSKAAIIVYDCTKPLTLQEVPKWIEQTKQCNKSTKIVIVGNKCESSRSSQSECYLYDFPHFRCSAKTGEGINEIFDHINKEIEDCREPVETIKLEDVEGKICMC